MLSDDYNLDTLLDPGVYNCYCTIWGIHARFTIKNIVIQEPSHNYYRQIAIPLMGNDSFVLIRYTRYDNNNNIVWTGWTPIDTYQYLADKITGLDSSISGISSTVNGHTTSISNLEKKFDNHENDGKISDCNYAPSGVSMIVSTTTNSPTPGTGFFVLWTMSTGAATNPAKLQIASAYGADYYYFRDLFNGIWSSWKRLDLS